MKNSAFSVFVLVFSLAFLTLVPSPGMGEDAPMKLPPARKIPGLTAEDKFPKGCVDCHINMPEIKKDERISVLMTRWKDLEGSKLHKKTKAAFPVGLPLKGTHPPATESLKNIPADCIACHNENPETAPPLGKLLHLIHLTGGEENHFLTIFQGECTHCHKIDTAGRWSIPSGPEK